MNANNLLVWWDESGRLKGECRRNKKFCSLKNSSCKKISYKTGWVSSRRITEIFEEENAAGNGRVSANAALQGIAIALRSSAKPYHGMSTKSWYGSAFVVPGIPRNSRSCWYEWLFGRSAFKNESWTVIFEEKKTFGARTSPWTRKPRPSSPRTEKAQE